MKTIILSLTIVLAQLISPAFAQVVKSYDGNNSAIIPANGYTPINIKVADPVKDISLADPNAYNHFPHFKTAGYISELGFLYREVDPGSVNNETVVCEEKNTHKKNNLK